MKIKIYSLVQILIQIKGAQYTITNGNIDSLSIL
jgi:hypothetical protein